MQRVRKAELVGVVAIGVLVGYSLDQSRPIGTEGREPEIVARALLPSGNFETRRGKADIAVVIYSDFQCPLCRQSEPDLRAAADRDGNVRVVYKEWPILGAKSQRASEVALAAKRQDLYLEVRDKLMATPLPLTEGKLRTAVEESGGDWEQIVDDIEAHAAETRRLFAENSREAVSLGFRGTPGYVIGDRVIEGALPRSDFARVLREVRQP